MENTEVTKIPFETTRVPDNTKPVGEEVVISDGVDGTRTVVTVDGHVTSDRTIAAKNEVVFYGTKEVENVSTPEPPQEETPEQPFDTVHLDETPPETPNVDDSEIHQGRFSEDGGKLKENVSMKSETLKKAALEAGRLLVFAIPGILITVLTNNPELGGSLGATILLVLKSIDRGIHEDKTVEANGLLPF